MLCVTNGCFDLLHRGHRHFFKELRKFLQPVDNLLVLVNSDLSVRKLKGPHRPIMSEKERSAALKDFLPTICALHKIEVVDDPLQYIGDYYSETPFFYAKDAESGLDGPEARLAIGFGRTVISIPRLPGISTTEIIKACSGQKQSS